jgi:hypothetical protein
MANHLYHNEWRDWQVFDHVTFSLTPSTPSQRDPSYIRECIECMNLTPLPPSYWLPSFPPSQKTIIELFRICFIYNRCIWQRSQINRLNKNDPEEPDKARTTAFPQKIKDDMSVQFCQFSLLPDFDLKLVSNQNPAKRIWQNRTTCPFSVAGSGRMKQRREFSGARPRLPRKLDI